jgi:hypothetical protein
MRDITAGDGDIYIDNQKLEGFLVSLQQQDCGAKTCDECGWFKKITDEVVKIDAVKKTSALRALGNLLDDLKSGKLFSYFK